MVDADGTALRAYHERTKHSVARLRSEPHMLDWENQPRPFKVYPDLSPIPLPTDLAGSQTLALDAIRDAASSTAPALDLRTIARLLYFSAGVLRRRTYPGGEIYFRAAACTGALYHIDVYLACRDLPDLAAGVYHFGPHDLALRRLRDGDHRGALVEATADDPAVRSAPVVLLLTSTFWRNAWKYRARTYRHCFWDAGTLLANLLAVTAAVGIPAHVVTGFVDATANRLLDVDPTREATLELVALGSDAPPPSASPPLDALDLATLPLSRHEVDQPLVREAHAASSLASTAAVRAWRNAPAMPRREEASAGVRVPLAPLPSAVVPQPIEAVILRRGSTRRFPRTPIALDQLATIIDCATRGVPLDVEVRPDLYVIAHAVDGLDPGAYACEPDGCALRLLRPGDLRSVAGHLGLGQDLPADAAANLYWLVDLEDVFRRLGDRGYRAAQLTAAIAGGRTYLAAYALGLGATGLTFFDDDVTAFLSPDAAGKAVMFLMAIGRRGGRDAIRSMAPE